MAQYDWDRRWDREHDRDWEERRRRESREGWGDRGREFRESGGEHRDRWSPGQWGAGRDQEREGQGEDWRRRQAWSGENRSEMGRDREYPSRADWGAQGRWGSYGNRSADWSQEREPGRDREPNRGDREHQNEEWMRTYGSGGGYGGGLSLSPETGRFAGRGPRNWRRSDERIREDINERLTDHPDIDASEIEVQVKNGEVTLAGTLNDRHSKRLAEDVAERVSGVKEVHNQIRIQAASQTGASVLSR
jgi:hypothetical protein